MELPTRSAGRPGSSAGPGTQVRRDAADITPQAMVEDRWLALAEELRGVVRPSGSLGADQLAQAGFDQLLDAALRAGLLDAATVRCLDGLRHLRNLARGSTRLSQRQAEEFSVMSDAVSYLLQRQARSVWPAT